MGELAHTTIFVCIDGERLSSYKSFRLEQRIGEHHRFSLCVDLETGGNRSVHGLGPGALRRIWAPVLA